MIRSKQVQQMSTRILHTRNYFHQSLYVSLAIQFLEKVEIGS